MAGSEPQTAESLQDRVRELEAEVARLRSGKRKAKIGKSDWWCTPPEITKPLWDLFGGPVDVDPCSNERSIVRARLAFCEGGLVRPWWTGTPGTVYQNDPYSQATVWTDKMLYEMTNQRVTELVRLSMMSTSTQWWQDMCEYPFCNPRILGIRRVAFLDPEAAEAGMKRQSCRFEPALTYFGPRTKEFTKTFAHLTRWAAWGR